MRACAQAMSLPSMVVWWSALLTLSALWWSALLTLSAQVKIR
ncbi:MAG TPA: hypothetical protein VFP68_13685 [Burkholderiaceae bacterium]|nr:hypothetical protein [Burkholderiaceae bacterium]